MKTLNLEQMEQVNGGKMDPSDVCGLAMTVVTSIWSTGFGMVAPWAGLIASVVLGTVSVAMCSMA